MRRNASTGLHDALTRWNTARMGAARVSPPPLSAVDGAASAEEADDDAYARLLAPMPSAARALVDMTQTQARHLALAFVRNQQGYLAYEVWRKESIYDLLVTEIEAGHSFVIHTARELTHLMAHLQDPTLLIDTLNGIVFVRIPLFEETYNVVEKCMSVAPYTLTARLDLHDQTGVLDLTVEPQPGPACDLDHLYLLADECLTSARGKALVMGERERALVLAEAGRRLKLYQHGRGSGAPVTAQR